MDGWMDGWTDQGTDGGSKEGKKERRKEKVGKQAYKQAEYSREAEGDRAYCLLNRERNCPTLEQPNPCWIAILVQSKPGWPNQQLHYRSCPLLQPTYYS